MSSGGQDIDNLDDLDGAEEDAQGTGNGNGTHPGVPDIKITYPKANARNVSRPPPVIDGQDALEAFAEKVTADWTVTREPSEGTDPRLVGVLPIKVTGADIKGNRLHDLLGRGVYIFSHGKARFRFPLATLTPPREFGTPAPAKEAAAATEWRYFYTPQGAPVPVPPGAPVPPGLFSAPPPALPFGYGHGQGFQQPQQNQAADIAKAIIEGLRPFLEKKNDGSDVKLAIEVEKMRLEQARIDANAKIAVAEADKQARIAEAKARETADSAKAQREHEAELARIKEQGETQKEVAKLNAEALKERAAGESSWFDRFLAMQESMGAKGGDDDELTKIDKLMRLADRFSNRNGERSMVTEVLQSIPAVIREAGTQLQGLRAPQQQQVVMQQIPSGASAAAAGAPQQQPGGLTLKEFMDAIKTAVEAILNGHPAERVVPLLRAKTPNMIAICAQKDPAAVLLEVETLAAQPGLPEESRAVLAQFKTLAVGDGRGWLEAFFKLVKGV